MQSCYEPRKGGRERIYHTNYRPAFEIKKEEFYSGNLIFHGKSFVKAGESIVGEVEFLHKKVIEFHLSVGKEFCFYEGPIRQGVIKIKQIKQL